MSVVLSMWTQKKSINKFVNLVDSQIFGVINHDDIKSSSCIQEENEKVYFAGLLIIMLVVISIRKLEPFEATMIDESIKTVNRQK